MQVVMSHTPLIDEEYIRIKEAIVKHHQACIQLAYSGEMYADKVFLSWYQTEEFNIWNIDFLPSVDAYLVEVSPRDYPNDIVTHRDEYKKPTDFSYVYTDIYKDDIYEIKNPRGYWDYLNTDISHKFPYIEGAETWPLFESAVDHGEIINIPEDILKKLELRR